ncbi:hypothetical protein E2C01_014527 [Portunus trituberculatus]|uniref:Uncharacterized protein n=1 Tax=Portunus trituberculatus TaxID=210409 RepID=A0A5B7DKE8_PORTR|nr:hypothetical protein [Portunus trituberculatus]
MFCRTFDLDLDLDATGGSGSLRSQAFGSAAPVKEKKSRKKSSILLTNHPYTLLATFSPETPSQPQSSFHSSLYTFPAATLSIPFLSSPLFHSYYALIHSNITCIISCLSLSYFSHSSMTCFTVSFSSISHIWHTLLRDSDHL